MEGSVLHSIHKRESNLETAGDLPGTKKALPLQEMLWIIEGAKSYIVADALKLNNGL